MRVPALIEKELVSCGVPYSVELGTRHLKILVGGVFCGICPTIGYSSNRRAELNVRAQIRRAVKRVKGNG